MPLKLMGPNSKIAVGWISIISVGLLGFLVAKISVNGNRKVLMDTRQRIKDQAEKEGAIEYERRRLQFDKVKNSS